MVRDGTFRGAAAMLAVHGVRDVPFYLRGAVYEGDVVEVVDGKVKLEFRLEGMGRAPGTLVHFHMFLVYISFLRIRSNVCKQSQQLTLRALLTVSAGRRCMSAHGRFLG